MAHRPDPGSPASAPAGPRDSLAQEARELLAPHSRRRTIAAGDLLWREGDDAGQLVAIENGRVKVYRVLPNGNAVTLYLFGPGDVFGFMPLLDGRPYPASAQALEDVTAMVVSRADLLGAFRTDPEVALALVRLLATRLRQAFDRIERDSVPEVLPRVAAALLTLAPAVTPAGQVLVLDLPVRSSEFAAAIGVAPESLSRAITKLVESGALHRLAPRRFQVLDLAALRREASGVRG